MHRKDLLLEVGTEEIPASFIPEALSAFKARCKEQLEKAYLAFDFIKTVGTPRRMVLYIAGLTERQPDRTELVVGPPKKVAFGPDGSATKAAHGFARKQGCSVEDIVIHETDRGPYAAIKKVIPGKMATELLSSILPGLITSIPFKKTMRWEASGVRFARPIRWIVALYGDQVIPFELAGVRSGRKSYGHRLMANRQIDVTSDLPGYLKTLEEAYVIADPDQRQNMVWKGACKAAEGVGGRVLEDKELLRTNTYLTEYPCAICGSFDREFLEVPRQVLVTAMREHQKYFAVVDEEGELLPNFIAINNILSSKPELVRKGHERVLRARLSDAAFFYHEDLKRSLSQFVPELEGKIFHEKLGSLLDKTKRIVALSEFLSQKLCPQELDAVKRAAYLCKADLLTEMVGEFPTLQGTMGRIYALKSGEPELVARAIEEHYFPTRAGGRLPGSSAGAVVSIADKIDTICSTFAIGLRPSGTADPYGLRRMALGILHILEDRSWSISLKGLVSGAVDQILEKALGKSLCDSKVKEEKLRLEDDILGFILRRLVHDLISRGLEQDVVEAAVRAGFDDPVDCIFRTKALSTVRRREEFDPLSLAFKRVMNILKEFEGGQVDPELFDAPEEKELYEAYCNVVRQVGAILGPVGSKQASWSTLEPDMAQRYEEALVVLLSLKPDIDRFFDNVLVMVKDPAMRANRLSLLWQISRLFLRIGDLSAIVVPG